MKIAEHIIVGSIFLLALIAAFTASPESITGNVVLETDGTEVSQGLIDLPGELQSCNVQDKANLVCTRENKPVCGTDGITYPNACLACQNAAPQWQVGTCESILQGEE